MRADRMPPPDDLLQHIGIFHRHLADDEEHCFHAVTVENVEDRRRALGVRPVIEGQHHFLVAQRQPLRELQRAEARPLGRIDGEVTAGQ
jgi:hypothetical protein